MAGYLSLNATSRTYRVSKTILSDAIRHGDLRVVRIGTRLFIHPKWVDDWQRRRSEQNTDLTTADIQERLGLSRRVVASRMCADGRLPGAYKTRGATGEWRLPVSAWDALFGAEVA